MITIMIISGVLLFIFSIVGGYYLTGVLISKKQLSTKNASKLLIQGQIEEWNELRSYLSDWRPNLSGLSFANANLAGADLRQANLENCDFSNARLDRANLTEVTLKGANLSNASLERTLLDSADLTNVKLSGANLVGASMQNAMLPKENLETIYGAEDSTDRLKTSEDLLREIYKLPELLNNLNHREFENFVAELFYRAGFNVELTPPVRDGGIDIYARKENEFSQLVYIIECKNYSSGKPVGVSAVRSLYAVKMDSDANTAFLVTNSRFTHEAENFAKKIGNDLQLIDGKKLYEMISLTLKK